MAALDGHERAIGILQIVYGAGVLVGGFLFWSFVSLFASGSGGGPVPGDLLVIVVVIMALLGVPAIVAGAGLLTGQPWARIVTLVLAGVATLNIPVGTAWGFYVIWALYWRTKSGPSQQQQTVIVIEDRDGP